jgi:hypothetical protein
MNGDDYTHSIHIGLMKVHVIYLWHRTFISAWDEVESSFFSRNVEADPYLTPVKLVAWCRN